MCDTSDLRKAQRRTANNGDSSEFLYTIESKTYNSPKNYSCYRRSQLNLQEVASHIARRTDDRWADQKSYQASHYVKSCGEQVQVAGSVR